MKFTGAQPGIAVCNRPLALDIRKTEGEKEKRERERESYWGASVKISMLWTLVTVQVTKKTDEGTARERGEKEKEETVKNRKERFLATR